MIYVLSQLIKSLLSLYRLRSMGIKCGFPLRVSSETDIVASKNVFIGKWTFIAVDRLVLGEGVSVDARCMLSGKEISIGDGTNVHGECRFVLGDAVLNVGKFCAISNRVSIWGIDHNTSLASLQAKFYHNVLGVEYDFVTKGEMSIGNDVLIGQGAIILPGVRVGDGAVVGAGSVVTKDVPSYSIVAGVPARLIKYRFSQEIACLLKQLQWWNWSIDEIRKNRDFFKLNLAQVTDPMTIEQTIR